MQPEFFCLKVGTARYLYLVLSYDPGKYFRLYVLITYIRPSFLRYFNVKLYGYRDHAHFPTQLRSLLKGIYEEYCVQARTSIFLCYLYQFPVPAYSQDTSSGTSGSLKEIFISSYFILRQAQ